MRLPHQHNRKSSAAGREYGDGSIPPHHDTVFGFYLQSAVSGSFKYAVVRSFKRTAFAGFKRSVSGNDKKANSQSREPEWPCTNHTKEPIGQSAVLEKFFESFFVCKIYLRYRSQ